ncbi:hypothetical protein [Nostoc sp.]
MRKITNAQCPMPNTQCPMPNTQCPMTIDFGLLTLRSCCCQTRLPVC